MFSANEEMYKNPNYDTDNSIGLADSSEVLFTLTPAGKIVSTGVSKATSSVFNSGKYVIKKSDEVYDDITLKMTGSVERIAPNTLTPRNTIMTIGGIEVTNDLLNPSMPANTKTGILYNMYDNLDDFKKFYFEEEVKNEK